MSASIEQLMLLGISCSNYAGSSFTSSVDGNLSRSCEICTNWSGSKCTIDVFDKVLTRLAQT